jgi:phospho-N-acetylmuramoyl-pentapeptide-transferase
MEAGKLSDLVRELSLAPFWVALLTSLVVAFPIYRMLLAMKSRQTVSQYAPEGHQLKQGTPTMGGIIIVAGILASLIYGGVRGILSPGFFGAALILLVGFALIGFVDDFVVPRLIKGKRGLGWKQKIVMQFVVAALAIGYLTHWQLSVTAAAYLFIILFLSNAYNFADGLDALAGTLLVILAGGLLALGQFSSTGPENRVLLHALIGATIPFLFMNAPPAKIFMGDVGSLPIGALFGLVFSSLIIPPGNGWTFYTPYSTLTSGNLGSDGSQFQPLMFVACLVVGFVMIAELVPVPMQIFWVKVFKRKLFPYTPIHHAFEKAGWPESRVVWTFALTQLVLAVIAFSLLTGMAAAPDRIVGRYHYYYMAGGAPLP